MLASSKAASWYTVWLSVLALGLTKGVVVLQAGNGSVVIGWGGMSWQHAHAYYDSSVHD